MLESRKDTCSISTFFVVTLSKNFGAALSGPILLHYQLVVELSVNLELHYRLIYIIGRCYIIGRNMPDD